jgi:hypothetical protein
MGLWSESAQFTNATPRYAVPYGPGQRAEGFACRRASQRRGGHLVGNHHDLVRIRAIIDRRAGRRSRGPQVGESHRVADDGGLGSCVPPDQVPRWGIPAAAAPRDVCGADNSPVQLSGSYDLVACGSDSACALGGKPVSARTLPSLVSLKIEQYPSDLSQGTVTLDGTGETVLDAQALSATFDRQSFVVHVDHSNLPATCIDDWTIDFSYDFEGFGTRSLKLFQTLTPDCTNAPDAYCKGQLSADLGEAHPHE